LCFSNEYVVCVYRASVPAELGTAAPRRGALSIASGVKRVELIADEMERKERRRMMRALGELILNGIVTFILKSFEEHK